MPLALPESLIAWVARLQAEGVRVAVDMPDTPDGLVFLDLQAEWTGTLSWSARTGFQCYADRSGYGESAALSGLDAEQAWCYVRQRRSCAAASSSAVKPNTPGFTQP